MALFKCNRCKAVYEDHYPPDDSCSQCNKGLIRIIPYQEENTMTAIIPTIKLFTTINTDTSIHINSLILEHNGNNYQLHAGTSDTIHVYIQSIAIYVLTINKSNGTIGLNAYMTPEPDPINSIYLHNNQEIFDYLGNKWESMKPLAIVQKLINYLY